MSAPTLTIDLNALTSNWRALDRGTASGVQTAAVVKADAYGLGMPRVARALAAAGARRFFVAFAEEGAVLRQTLGQGPQICVLSGHMAGDTEMISDLDLTLFTDVEGLVLPDGALLRGSKIYEHLLKELRYGSTLA